MSKQSQPVCPLGGNSIAIELLRTGTPHNQTLSPGVTYLALCGSHPPAEFRINLEQYKFSRYLQLLRYQEGTEGSSVQLAKEALQEIITKIFEDIPALQTEANFSEGWLHLRLIMSPRELAMLPFEIALTPNGFQGGRQKPFLQNPQRLTTITREIRQVAAIKHKWPVKPRILFAWSDAEAPVPHQQHREKLQQALVSWTLPVKKNPDPTEDYGPLLTEVPNMTFASLRTAVLAAVQEGRPYTHIHILSHGIPIPDTDNGPQYALALHLEEPFMKDDGTLTKVDAVDGGRLTDALLVVENNDTITPEVVTIAACDGGNEGTNLLPGGSLGHILHQSGVPYVLASQFPLSISGSTQLVDTFYTQTLQGEDPRIVLYFARQELMSKSKVHDWASVVAYARFADDFADHLEDIKLSIAFEMMKAANGWTDHLTQHKISTEQAYKKVENRLGDAIRRLEKLLPEDVAGFKNKPRLAEHFGLLGSAYKRLSEHFYQQATQLKSGEEELRKQSLKELDKARIYYRRGHDAMLTHHWTAVQYLSLTALFKGTLETEHDRWCVAHFAAINDLQKATGRDRLWPLGSLAELYLLKPFTGPADKFEEEKTKALKKAGSYLDELDEFDFLFEKESTARQLDRYSKWWPTAFSSTATSSTTAAQLQEMAASLREHLRIILE